MQDTLLPDQVLNEIDTEWLGRSYLYLPTTTSTNDILKEQASAGNDALPPDGTVLLTDFQQHGRGRLDRSWTAPRGSSLLFSVLLRPLWPAENIGWLTMICGLAVSEAVEELSGRSARLKWPNDGVLKVDSTWQKYCGILLEGHIDEANLLAHAVAGIGVNVNIPRERLPESDFPATSLLAADGRLYSRLKLFAKILSRLEHHYQMADSGHSPHHAWHERLIYMNEPVTIRQSGSKNTTLGTAIGTDSGGRLLVRAADSIIHYIPAGDISLRADENR